MIENRFRLAVLLLSASVLLASCSCERATQLKVEPGPLFLLNGSGRLATFTVYGPRPGHKIATPYDTDSILWQIKAPEGYFTGKHVEGLRVKYGEIPINYVQAAPYASKAAPQLVQGNLYFVLAETTDAAVKSTMFYVGKDRPIEVDVPDLCIDQIGGHVSRLKCGTTEPYQEPADIDNFVRMHQVVQ